MPFGTELADSAWARRSDAVAPDTSPGRCEPALFGSSQESLGSGRGDESWLIGITRRRRSLVGLECQEGLDMHVHNAGLEVRRQRSGQRFVLMSGCIEPLLCTLKLEGRRMIEQLGNSWEGS